jgi:hypothetical protein
VGLAFGGTQAASPLAFWWLDAVRVYALGLVLIASVYIGFAVAYGRWVVIAVETNIAAIFVVVAAAAVTESRWLLVVGLAGHGLKDLWQHRTHFVANTRWCPTHLGVPVECVAKRGRSWSRATSHISTTAAMTSRLQAGVCQLEKEGATLRWLRSFLLVSEETDLCLVAASDPDHVAQLNQRAGLEYEHVVEVVAIEPPAGESG